MTSMEKMKLADRLAASQIAKQGIQPGYVEILLGDARNLAVASGSVQLIVTSPPYYCLKQYDGGQENQLGSIQDFGRFVAEMRKALAECWRALIPGGRICLNTGDVCLSRKAHGKHTVLPLHAHYQVILQELGFDLLTPIVWHKIGNLRREGAGASGCLGKPYEPNSVIRNEVEWILIARKPGPYRKPSDATRLASMLDRADFASWMTQVWKLPGASTRGGHPAPFPIEIPHRLISLHSFAGDTVLDPFAGSGTTGKAARGLGRNAVLVDCSSQYVELMQKSTGSL